MGCRVVTIAMTTGARAEEVARLAADELGFHYINDEIIDWAAEYAGVSRQAVEEVEHSRSLVGRILTLMGSGTFAEMGAPPLTPEEIDASPSYRRLIQAVIRETAARGNVVIVAHAASILLAGTPSLLRVLVTASPAERAARLIVESGIDERRALRELERSDRERRAYFKRFYNLDEELPTHYDLVVNTDVLAVEAAARVIACAALSVND